MFDGLKNNRAHWAEQAEVYTAKMKIIEDEKKRLEGGAGAKGKDTKSATGEGVDGCMDAWLEGYTRWRMGELDIWWIDGIADEERMNNYGTMDDLE